MSEKEMIVEHPGALRRLGRAVSKAGKVRLACAALAETGRVAAGRCDRAPDRRPLAPPRFH